MTRWTIYDEIRDDLDALDRIKAELLALIDTNLSDEQSARLLRVALELRILRARAQARAQNRPSTSTHGLSRLRD